MHPTVKFYTFYTFKPPPPLEPSASPLSYPLPHVWLYNPFSWADLQDPVTVHYSIFRYNIHSIDKWSREENSKIWGHFTFFWFNSCLTSSTVSLVWLWPGLGDFYRVKVLLQVFAACHLADFGITLLISNELVTEE